MFLYGYDSSLVGDSFGLSVTVAHVGKDPNLGWDFMDRKPGITMSEALGASN